MKFDGRKDLTLQKDGRTIREEHWSVIAEPGPQYLDHFTPESGLMGLQQIFDFVLVSSRRQDFHLGCRRVVTAAKIIQSCEYHVSYVSSISEQNSFAASPRVATDVP